MQTFEDLCSANYTRIFKYCLGMVKSREISEDLTQTVFLIAHTKGKEFLNHEKPTAFLYKTAQHLVFEHLRKAKKEILTAPDGAAFDKPDDDLFTEICQRQDLMIDEQTYKEEVLARLSDKNYLIYKRYYLEHKPMSAISQEMGISSTALRMRYVRLRREVLQAVKKLRLGEI